MRNAFQMDGNLEETIEQDVSDDDPLVALGIEKETLEDWARQFCIQEESVKVKNLSDDDMDEAVKAYPALGSKLSPVDLDFDRKQMQGSSES